MQNPIDFGPHDEAVANPRPGGARGARLALGVALALGAVFLLASPASAKNEFENGFKDELGRITAHEVAFIGRGVLGQVLHGGVITTVQHRGGGRGRGGGHGAYGGPGGQRGGGHHVQPHHVRPRAPYYDHRRPRWQRPHFWKKRGHGHYKRPRHDRGHRHGRRCHH